MAIAQTTILRAHDRRRDAGALPHERVLRPDDNFVGLLAATARRGVYAKFDQNRIAGIVVLVLRDGKPIYERALGWSDKEANRPMRVDSIFRIASQTKALTSAAILALREEGRLSPNMPVGRFMPAYEKTTVAVKGEAGASTVPARRSITIADLLTHTAGISYGIDSLVAADYDMARSA